MLIICQTVEGISMVGQFRDFLRSIFGQVFDIRHYCAAILHPIPSRRLE